MKILEVSEYYFGLHGVLVLDKSRSAAIKAFFKNFIILFLVGPFCVPASAAYIYYNPDKFEYCVQAFAGLCAGTLATGKYFSLKLNEKQIKMFIETFQETVDKAPVEIRKLYFDAETKGRRFTQYAVRTMLSLFLVIFGSCSLISAFYNIKLGRFDTQKWFQILYLHVPYEHYTVPEYFLKLSVTLVMSYGYSMTSMFVEMDKLLQRNSQSNSQEVKICTVRVVKLHIRLLELAELLSGIMSASVFFQMLCNVGLIAGLLNLLEVDEFSLTTIESLIGVFSSIFLLYLYCYHATQISTMLEQIGDVAYHSPWYNYPIEMQKSIILIIGRAQVPFHFNGLNMFVCNLEIFVSILRLICSYYLMLNRINRN